MRRIRHWFYLTLRINFCSRASSTKNVSRPLSAGAGRNYFSKLLFYTLSLFERLANFIHDSALSNRRPAIGPPPYGHSPKSDKQPRRAINARRLVVESSGSRLRQLRDAH